MPITNRGKFRTLRALAHDEAWPVFFRVALVSDVPTPDTKTMSELTEIAAGNGYTSGGVQITRDVTGFPAVVEDDADNLASAQIKDVPIAASGGTIPASGGAINYAVLIDDNATLADAEIWAYSYVLQDTIANGETLTLANWLLQLLEAFMSGVSNAANIGADGVGLFKQKNGDVLEFRNINAASARISVAIDAPNNEVDIDLGTVALDDLDDVSAAVDTANFVLATPDGSAGDYVGRALVDDDIPNVPNKDIAAIHTNMASEVAGLTEVTPEAGDWLYINDASNSNAPRKVDADNFLSAGGITASVSVYASANVNLSTTPLILTWDSEDWDTDAYHHTVTNNTRLTIPADLGGLYVLRCLLSTINVSNGQGQGITVEILVDGNSIRSYLAPTGSNAQCFIAFGMLLNLVPTNYVEIRVTLSSGVVAVVRGSAGARVQLARVGDTNSTP